MSNKAFKLARFPRWDWRAASPLILRYVTCEVPRL